MGLGERRLGATRKQRNPDYQPPNLLFCASTGDRLGFTTYIAVSASYCLALKGDGTVWAWGDAGHFASGWGVAITQEYGMIFAAWYTYDASGKAIWYVSSSCPVIGNGCTGDQYQVTAGSSFTSPWNGSNKVVTGIGSVTFTFSDANNGVMAYSVNGLTGSRNITRQGF